MTTDDKKKRGMDSDVYELLRGADGSGELDVALTLIERGLGALLAPLEPGQLRFRDQLDETGALAEVVPLAEKFYRAALELTIEPDVPTWEDLTPDQRRAAAIHLVTWRMRKRSHGMEPGTRH